MRFDRLKRVSNCLVGTSSILGSAILPSCTEVKADAPMEDYLSVCQELTKDRYYWLYYLLRWSPFGSLLKRSILNRISKERYNKDLKTLCQDAVGSMFSDDVGLKYFVHPYHYVFKKEMSDTGDLCTVKLYRGEEEILDFDSKRKDYFEKAYNLIKAFKQIQSSSELFGILQKLANREDLCKFYRIKETNDFVYELKDPLSFYYLSSKVSQISFKTCIDWYKPKAFYLCSYCDDEGELRYKENEIKESDFDLIIGNLERKLRDISKESRNSTGKVEDDSGSSDVV